MAGQAGCTYLSRIHVVLLQVVSLLRPVLSMCDRDDGLDFLGGFGVDFSLASKDISSGVSLVAKKILEQGVTSFCPTLVTSPPSVYHQVSQHLSQAPCLNQRIRALLVYVQYGLYCSMYKLVH